MWKDLVKLLERQTEDMNMRHTRIKRHKCREIKNIPVYLRIVLALADNHSYGSNQSLKFPFHQRPPDDLLHPTICYGPPFIQVALIYSNNQSEQERMIFTNTVKVSFPI